MVWTTPKSWVPGELDTVAYMNAQVRDNLILLKTQRDASAVTQTLYSQSTAITYWTSSGEKDLWSFTLAANMLGTNGDKIWIRFGTVMAGNTASKTFKLYVNTMYCVLITNAVSVAGNLGVMDIVITRLTSTTAHCDAMIVHGAYTGGTCLSVSSAINTGGGAIDFTASQTVKVTGQGTTTNDLGLYRPVAVVIKD